MPMVPAEKLFEPEDYNGHLVDEILELLRHRFGEDFSNEIYWEAMRKADKSFAEDVAFYSEYLNSKHLISPR